MLFFGHPCDRPKDIRARPFILSWATKSRKAPSKYKDSPRPVFRVEYRCLGGCNSEVSAVNSDDSEVDDEQDEDEQDDSEDEQNEDGTTDSDEEGEKAPKGLDQEIKEKGMAKKRGHKSGRCPNKVKIHIEVWSDDLSKAIVYQQNIHHKSRHQFLEMSAFIRQNILELAMLANMTASQIKLRLLTLCEIHEVPRYRWPTPSQVNNIVQNTRRKERLLNDPLLAIGVFARKNKDKIFYYSEPNYDNDPPTGFATGIHHQFAVQALILWSCINGVGLDSSYRHKNENRAPVTFITTIDGNSHMLPGPVFLSSDVTAHTLALFLTKVKELVEKMAADLVKGRAKVDDGLKSDRKQLLREAKKIVDAKDGWCPFFFMIDKSKPSRAAIFQVFPHAIVRICQFHVMQAILRWDKEAGDSFETQTRPRLSLERKHHLLRAVRELQRCRYPKDWDSTVSVFKDAVKKICVGSTTSAIDIIRYFEANWFTPTWRDLWTDIGLPVGSGREKMLSTNNWTERAFKTFDQVFLAGRANKSAYRLVLIIANQWFEYYRFWRNEEARFNKEAFDEADMAYHVWNRQKGIDGYEKKNSGELWKVVYI